MDDAAQKLLEFVQLRLAKKRARAELSYIRARTTKETRNCRHRGPSLGDRLSLCKLKCQGVDEVSAAQCFDEKARGCSEFALVRGVEQLRAEFRAMEEGELALRWPSIGELLWVVRKVEDLRDSETGVSGVPSGREDAR